MEALNLRPYCTSDYISGLHTISQDLSIVGLPAIALYKEKDPGPTITSLINTVWTLLQYRQTLVDGKRDAENRIDVITGELKYLQEKYNRLEKNLTHVQDSLKKEKVTTVLADSEKSETLQNTKFLKQEIKELKQKLKDQDTQFKHEIRRYQNDISLFQTKLRNILSKEKRETWKGPVDSSAKIQPSDEEATSKENVYKKSICRLQNNVQTLVKENLELRKLLDNVSCDLALLMKQANLVPVKDNSASVQGPNT